MLSDKNLTQKMKMTNYIYIVLSIAVYLGFSGVALAQDDVMSASQIEKSLFPEKVVTRGIRPVTIGGSNSNAASSGENTGSDQVQVTTSTVGSNQPPSVSLEAITFEYDSATLTNLAKQQIQQLAIVLQNRSGDDYKFNLIGHTDAAGGNEYNMALSEKRAISVVNYLASTFGFSKESFSVIGKGELQLANPNDPYASENRRVEITRQ